MAWDCPVIRLIDWQAMMSQDANRVFWRINAAARPGAS